MRHRLDWFVKRIGKRIYYDPEKGRVNVGLALKDVWIFGW